MKNIVALVICLALPITLSAQAPNKFVSQLDRSLSVKKIGVLPSSDNVKGIYARAIEAKIIELLQATTRFEYVDLKGVDPSMTLKDYEQRPKTIQELKTKYSVDAVLASRATKIGDGVNLELSMFLTNDGLVLIEDHKDGVRFDTGDVERVTKEMYTRLLTKFPYKGVVLSRQGNRVTLDIGASEGLVANTVINAEQFLALKRHPKFNFIVSVEKEILGKIKIIKTDETLSFGVIVQEKGAGAIEPDTKLSGIDYVKYEEVSEDSGLPPPTTLKDPISFGENPKEWRPEEKPRYGKVGMFLGLGNQKYTMVLSEAGSLSSNNPVYPQLDLNGELWFTPVWFFGGGIRQGVLNYSNPRGGQPSNLNGSTAAYNAHVGYRFLLQDDFWGPQLKLNLGFGQYSFFVDDSSPRGFTSMSYAGLYTGIGGWLPLDNQKLWFLNVDFRLHIAPGMTESPASSGASSSNSITNFSFGGSYKLSTRFYAKGSLLFEFFSSTFDGKGSRDPVIAGDNVSDGQGQTASQTGTTLFGGIDYYF